MKQPGDEQTDIIAIALAAGKTQLEAAAAGNVKRSTVQRLVKESAFQERIRELRRGMAQQALGLFAQGLPDAAALFHLAIGSDEPMAVRLKAGKDLVELWMKLRSSEDLADQVAVLRDQVAELRGRGPVDPA